MAWAYVAIIIVFLIGLVLVAKTMDDEDIDK